MIYGNTIGGSGGASKTIILQDEAGNQVVAVLVGKEEIFDATPNDIREGKVAATNEGVTVGTKNIPTYRTHQGVKVITVNSNMSLNLANFNAYDYTKLQAVICERNTSLEDSVAVSKVVIDDNVYEVLSTVAISEIVKNDIEKSVDFGIKNTSDKPYIVRYFTYKEEV